MKVAAVLATLFASAAAFAPAAETSVVSLNDTLGNAEIDGSL